MAGHHTIFHTILFERKISQIGSMIENFLLAFKPEELSFATDLNFHRNKLKQF